MVSELEMSVRGISADENCSSGEYAQEEHGVIDLGQ